eukprot:GHVL01036937.1.p1 GENE.GHVL01036937.1~~GHVL01036937.1.p1  ORF type:complete len:297 (+),score=72.83 GHVL01036937.1:325-1215(+)
MEPFPFKPQGSDFSKYKINESGVAKMDSDLDDDENEAYDNETDERWLIPHGRVFQLHGSLSREDRFGFLKDFKKMNNSILITTDVAARGLNLPHVDLVVQLDIPAQIEEYVHRVGRTARIGLSGKAIIFLMPHEIDGGFLKLLEEKTNVKIQEYKIGKHVKPLIDLLPAKYRTHDKSEGADTLGPLLGFIYRHIESNEELLYMANKAYVANYRAYRCLSREIKSHCLVDQLHYGHLASSYGIKSTPKEITSYLNQDTQDMKPTKNMKPTKIHSHQTKRAKKNKVILRPILDEFAAS